MGQRIRQSDTMRMQSATSRLKKTLQDKQGAQKKWRRACGAESKSLRAMSTSQPVALSESNSNKQKKDILRQTGTNEYQLGI